MVPLPLFRLCPLLGKLQKYESLGKLFDLAREFDNIPFQVAVIPSPCMDRAVSIHHQIATNGKLAERNVGDLEEIWPWSRLVKSKGKQSSTWMRGGVDYRVVVNMKTSLYPCINQTSVVKM